MTTIITREKYEAGVEAAAGTMLWAQSPGVYARRAVDAFLATANIGIERTPEERIAAFVAAAREFNGRRGVDFIWTVIDAHFPEVRACG